MIDLRPVNARCLGAIAAVVMLLAAPAASTVGEARQADAAALPARLTDTEFWKLSTEISEPGGYFRITDNYTSNEIEIGQLFTMLRDQKVSGGVYVGVGPEQNFSYIASIQPAMAFVVDIRRQAVIQHLMFKAMFELAGDRVEFISLLFAKPRPKDLDKDAAIQRIWEAYFPASTDLALAARTRERVIELLVKTKKFELTTDELGMLDTVLAAFVQFGPGISTRGSLQGRGGGNNVTFADLTGWSPPGGPPQTFLSTDQHFRFVKTMHEKNLIVPASGDFGGPKTLRAIASYITARKARLSAFYVSNVEQYLFQDFKAQAFYDNVATFPLTDSSVFIRPYALRRIGSQPLCGIVQFLKAVQAGRMTTNNEATACAG